MKRIIKFFGFGKKPKQSMIEMTLFKEHKEDRKVKRNKTYKKYLPKYKWEEEGVSVNLDIITLFFIVN